MSDDFMFLPVVMLKQQAIIEIRNCNEYTAKYGLQLTEEEMNLLVENRNESLINNGRIEFGGGVLRKLIMEFADSPYIYQDNYSSTIMELQECFYYFKNESEEDIIDDELIRLMKNFFNDECQGSVEYLQSTKLENITRDVRYGTKDYRDLDGYEDNYIDFLDYDRDDF
jgi:uncharacterized protein YbcC (UPF0753/DUF2309 family)